MNSRIFIGSSSESLETAKGIKKYLNVNGYDAIGWWDPGSFPLGGVTLDILVRQAREVGGAVFVHASDDEVWREGEPIIANKPRDNVVLEYGIFVSQVGRENVVIVKYPKAKLASDVSGITNLLLSEADIASIREYNAGATTVPPSITPPPRVLTQIETHFRERARVANLSNVNASVVSIGDLDQKILHGRNKLWSSRNIYLDHRGAKMWIEISAEDLNTPAGQYHLISRKIKNILKTTNAENVISFGPGDGKLDCEIVTGIRRRNKHVGYIPIDISPYLLLSAREEMISHEIPVPFAVHGDIESDLASILSYVSTRTLGPYLYLMLGGTFANIEESEDLFFSNVHHKMKGDDHLLLDAYIFGEGYTDELDLVSNMRPQFIKLLGNSIAIKTNAPLAPDPEEIAARLEVHPAVCDLGDAAKAYVIRDKHHSDKDETSKVLHFRRYDYNGLANWLENDAEFEVIDKAAVFAEGETVGRGIYLLKKRPS